MSLFLCSSAVEQLPVKQLVVGSIPTGGADLTKYERSVTLTE